MSKNKNDDQLATFLDDIGQIACDLHDLGFVPILVGGMALTLLGSDRVTQDFDFVVTDVHNRTKELVAVFYDKGFELASRLDGQGKITATLDNRRVAGARLELDQPESAYFLNPKTGLRVDLLFNFPIPANELAVQADTIKIRSYNLSIAAPKDLLRLKTIAVATRSKPGDAQDISFLTDFLKTH